MHLLQALVHEIRVERRNRVVPGFHMPGGGTKVRALWRRRGVTGVPPASLNANLEPLVEGPAISLVAAHTKIRRAGCSA